MDKSFTFKTDLMHYLVSMAGYVRYFGAFSSDDEVLDRLSSDDEDTRLATAHIAVTALRMLQMLVSELPTEIMRDIHAKMDYNQAKNSSDTNFVKNAEARKKQLMAKLKPSIQKLQHDPKNPKTIDGKLKPKKRKKLAYSLPYCANLHLN